ncbi:MAG: bifunctional 5,10-methylenetetrahydrofolate dehydrogenase/5,10-methenyltetrahydrofolate cyclohydrolase [Dongiaceae bacterium]
MVNNQIIDGRKVANGILAELAEQVEDLKKAGWGPKLNSITIGDVDAVHLYVRNQKRAAEKAGLLFEEHPFPADTTQEQMLAAISAMNADPRVTGIILQRPVPHHLSIKTLQAAIHPLKDVEGMHPASIGNIVYNEVELGPCTAMASVELLKRTGLKLPGLEVVVVGHSEIVGKPIAFLLMSEGATVTVCHHMTRNLSVHSRRADALFVAVGKPGLITGEMVKPDAAVIDIGINQISLPDGSTKVVGDVDYDSVLPVCGWITPVPGGVGPVTVAVLLRNAVIGAQRQRKHYERLFGSNPAAE